MKTARAWARLERWLGANLPEVLEDLRPGADIVEILAAERAIGQKFPDDLREAFLIHDGQLGETTGIFFGLPMHSLTDVVGEWQSWHEIDEATNEELSESCTSEPEGAIRCVYACDGWIPISNDSGGNNIGVDVLPGPNGTVGQVINCGRDEEDKIVLATSFGEFLEAIVDDLESGRFTLDPFSRELNYPGVQHFLDAAPSFARARNVILRD